MRTVLILLTCALLVASAASCSEPARRPDKPATPAAMGTAEPVRPLPVWTEGEFPAGKTFWGAGRANISGTEDEAKTAAVKAATANLTAETALLAVALKADHEAQVAEIVTRYSTEEFDAHIDAALVAAQGKVAVVETYVDKTRSPKRMHVLVTLSLDDTFAAIYAREGLPAEQKDRIKDYEHVFRDGVMANLSR
jgi:hypothetical protein